MAKSFFEKIVKKLKVKDKMLKCPITTFQVVAV